MGKIKILALIGESSAGKDTIQRWLVENLPNAHGIVSYTSRPPRDYEVDGVDYHFVSTGRFMQLFCEDKILESSVFNNWFYGTGIDDLEEDKINIGVFNPEGISNLYLKRITLHDIEILPVWIKVDDKTRLLRSLKREKNPDCEEICRRFLTDKKDFEEFEKLKIPYEIFENNDYTENYNGILNRPMVAEFIKGQN